MLDVDTTIQSIFLCHYDLGELIELQPPIMAFLPISRDNFAGYAKKAGGRRCDRLFLDHFDGIMATIDRCAAARSRFRGMIERHADDIHAAAFQGSAAAAKNSAQQDIPT